MNQKLTCDWCGYTGPIGLFKNEDDVPETCPACCADLETGRVEKGSVARVFYIPERQIEVKR